MTDSTSHASGPPISQSVKVEPAPPPTPALEGRLADQVVGSITARLQAYDGKGGPTDDDNLFQDHTSLIRGVLGKENERLVPIKIWDENLAAVTAATEKRIGRPLHKGAPFFNMGVILFYQNDFDGAYFYFAQAEIQDRAGGAYALPRILIGDHPLSRQMLVDPLVTELLPSWAKEYQEITNRVLDVGEFIDLMRWLVLRSSDAFMFLTALHRLRLAMRRDPASGSVRLIKVRVLADILVVLESALRRLQGNAVTGQLHARLLHALAGNHRVLASFNVLHTWSNGLPAADKETAVGVNAVVHQAEGAFLGTASCADRAGIAAYVSYRLRNSVLHVNEENLDVFTDPILVLRILGWAVATCRTAKHTADATLVALP